MARCRSKLKRGSGAPHCTRQALLPAREEAPALGREGEVQPDEGAREPRDGHEHQDPAAEAAQQQVPVQHEQRFHEVLALEAKGRRVALAEHLAGVGVQEKLIGAELMGLAGGRVDARPEAHDGSLGRARIQADGIDACLGHEPLASLAQLEGREALPLRLHTEQVRVQRVIENVMEGERDAGEASRDDERREAETEPAVDLQPEGGGRSRGAAFERQHRQKGWRTLTDSPLVREPRGV